MNKQDTITYAEAGVDEPREQAALLGMLTYLKETYSFRSGIGKPYFQHGLFANVLDLGMGLGLGITTDGVGTKLLLAKENGQYEGIAIDCVANNVNDLLCIGAEPIALVDYIGLNIADELFLAEIARGLMKGAKYAGISIPGGEIAQVRDLLQTHTNSLSFDLVGTAVGVVALTDEQKGIPQLLRSESIMSGDVLIGIASSGLHSNGYSLARKALFDIACMKPEEKPAELNGRTIVEELLIPTHVYVQQVLPLLKGSSRIKAVANISGGGLLSICRINENYSYHVDTLMDVPPIFRLIQDSASLKNETVFAALNMGIGMVLVADSNDLDSIVSHIESTGVEAKRIGHVVDDSEPGRIFLEPIHLVGRGEVFTQA